MTCSCGQGINTTGLGYSYRVYDGYGNVRYEVCIHGIVTIDTRQYPETQDNDSEGMCDY